MNRALNECQVVVVAGGEGSRLLHRTRGIIPKYLLGIYNEKILDYVLYPYVSTGLQDYHFLIAKKFLDKTERHMRRKYRGLNVDYSLEYKKLGKGGAIRKALLNGIIDRENPSVVVFGDDIITMPYLCKRLFRSHAENRVKKRIATLVRVAELELEFGMPEVSKRDPTKIVRFVEKPLVNVPASCGTYVADPGFYDIILKQPRVFNTEDKVFPKLARRDLLGAFTMLHKHWLPVNDEKQLESAERELERLNICLNV